MRIVSCVIIPEASLNSFVRVEYAICGLPKRQRCSTPLEHRAPLEFVERRLIWEGRVDRFDLITRFSFAKPDDSQSKTLRGLPPGRAWEVRGRQRLPRTQPVAGRWREQTTEGGPSPGEQF